MNNGYLDPLGYLPGGMHQKFGLLTVSLSVRRGFPRRCVAAAVPETSFKQNEDDPAEGSFIEYGPLETASLQVLCSAEKLPLHSFRTE